MTKYIYPLAIVILANGCGGGGSGLSVKKEALSQLKNQAVGLQVRIKALEKEIIGIDSTFLEANNNSVSSDLHYAKTGIFCA